MLFRVHGFLLLLLASLAATCMGRTSPLAEIIQQKFKMGDAKLENVMVEAAEATPPRPLQVFEYGPSTRKEWRNSKKKFKHQLVCLIDREGGGTWYKRSYPWLWWKNPPFHVRIVRPNYPGMLHFLLNNKVVKVEYRQEEMHLESGETRSVMVHRVVKS
ncbi:unnamed protein product [Chrysoparadoxa australica]